MSPPLKPPTSPLAWATQQEPKEERKGLREGGSEGGRESHRLSAGNLTTFGSRFLLPPWTPEIKLAGPASVSSAQPSKLPQELLTHSSVKSRPCRVLHRSHGHRTLPPPPLASPPASHSYLTKLSTLLLCSSQQRKHFSREMARQLKGFAWHA